MSTDVISVSWDCAARFYRSRWTNPLNTTPFRKRAIEFSDAISGRIIVRNLREERRTRMRPRLGSTLLRASGEYPMDSLARSALSRLHLRTQI